MILPLAAVLAGAAPAPTSSAAADRVRGHVEFLANDLLEGRETGTRGHEVAAAYVASQFRALGLKPGGKDGSWYQQVPFRRATLTGAPTIRYTVGGKPATLTQGVDLTVRPSLVQAQASVDAGLAFVGFGNVDRQLGLDDYAGVDVRGRIVVALSGMPKGLPSDVAAHLGQIKAQTAAQRGAVGFVELPAGSFPPVGPLAARPLTNWADAQGNSGQGAASRLVRMALSQQLAERLFTGAPRTLAAVQADAKSRKPQRAFLLPGQLSIQAASQWQDFTSPQVVALLPGSDPQLSAEHVALMAHLDHIGVKKDAKPGEDAVNNGALDNASGIATMLETARGFVASGQAPKRSLLFLAVTGEEIGLLGADHFAANPVVPLDRIVGLVNLDMPLLLYPFGDVIPFGAEHSTVARMVAEAGRSMGVATAADPMPEQGLFTRSDHYRFVTRGVPSVFLMTGYANGGEAHWKKFLGGGCYHAPCDDLKQGIDWAAAARFAELNFRIARALADAPERPRWYADSYFGKAFAAGQPTATR